MIQHQSNSVTIGTIGTAVFTHLGRGVGMIGGGEDDRSMNVNKNNYSIIINIYSINIQSYISYHYPLPALGEKNALSFVTIVTLAFGILFGLHYH